METKAQQELGLYCPCPNDGVDVNRRVWYRDLHELRAVFVDITPFYVFERSDEVQYRFRAAQLVDAELATVIEVCDAFGIPQRTFSRIRQLVRKGGIEALRARKLRRQQSVSNPFAVAARRLTGASASDSLGLRPRLCAFATPWPDKYNYDLAASG